MYADSGGSASNLFCVDAQLDVVSIHTWTFTCCVANNRMLDPPICIQSLCQDLFRHIVMSIPLLKPVLTLENVNNWSYFIKLVCILFIDVLVHAHECVAG